METIFIILSIVAVLLAIVFFAKYIGERDARKYAEEGLIKFQNKYADLESELGKVRSNALVTSVKLQNLQDRIVEIEDTAPKGNRPVDNVLCLQDKLKHYVRSDGTKVRLTILK